MSPMSFGMKTSWGIVITVIITLQFFVLFISLLATGELTKRKEQKSREKRVLVSSLPILMLLNSLSDFSQYFSLCRTVNKVENKEGTHKVNFHLIPSSWKCLFSADVCLLLKQKVECGFVLTAAHTQQRGVYTARRWLCSSVAPPSHFARADVKPVAFPVTFSFLSKLYLSKKRETHRYFHVRNDGDDHRDRRRPVQGCYMCFPGSFLYSATLVEVDFDSICFSPNHWKKAKKEQSSSSSLKPFLAIQWNGFQWGYHTSVQATPKPQARLCKKLLMNFLHSTRHKWFSSFK